MLRTTVATLTPQQLAIESRYCDPAFWSGEHVNRGADYCAEVSRALDDQPLQAVAIRRNEEPIVESWEFEHPEEWAKRRHPPVSTHTKPNIHIQ
jgi:hypothetical protein